MIIVGFLILILGGDWLIKAAVSIAGRFGVSPAIIGLTIIAAGTSAPELVTSFIASIKEAPDVAIGNVVGSNIFNILAILGIASLMKPNKVEASFDKIEIPMLIACSMLFVFFLWDQTYQRYEGALSLAVLLLMFVISIFRAKQEGLKAEEDLKILSYPFLDILYLVIGCVALIGGAHIVLENGIVIGNILGLSERIIGITIISAGTGLPELVASTMAALKGRDDIAVGNIIGSNLFNTMGVAGAASLAHPLQASPEIASFDSFLMLGITVLLFIVVKLNKLTISRTIGGLFLFSYIGYLALLFYR